MSIRFMIWNITLIYFLLEVLLVTFEVLFFSAQITALLFLWASRTPFLGFLLFSAVVDLVLIRGGVVISESDSEPDNQRHQQYLILVSQQS